MLEEDAWLEGCPGCAAAESGGWSQGSAVAAGVTRRPQDAPVRTMALSATVVRRLAVIVALLALATPCTPDRAPPPPPPPGPAVPYPYYYHHHHHYYYNSQGTPPSLLLRPVYRRVVPASPAPPPQPVLVFGHQQRLPKADPRRSWWGGGLSAGVSPLTLTSAFAAPQRRPGLRLRPRVRAVSRAGSRARGLASRVASDVFHAVRVQEEEERVNVAAGGHAMPVPVPVPANMPAPWVPRNSNRKYKTSRRHRNNNNNNLRNTRHRKQPQQKNHHRNNNNYKVKKDLSFDFAAGAHDTKTQQQDGFELHAPTGDVQVRVTVPTHVVRPLMSSLPIKAKRAELQGEQPSSFPYTPSSSYSSSDRVEIVGVDVVSSDPTNTTVVLTLRDHGEHRDNDAIGEEDDDDVSDGDKEEGGEVSEDFLAAAGDDPKRRSEGEETEEDEEEEEKRGENGVVMLVGDRGGRSDRVLLSRPKRRLRRRQRRPGYGMNNRIRAQMLAHRLFISYRHVQPCAYKDRYYCMNGGTCVFVGALDIRTCRCPIGYTGVRCELIDQEYILSLLTDSIIFS